MNRLLMIGWDGASWGLLKPLLDAGKLPHLNRLISGGAMGELASPPPLACPLIWTTLATGQPADQHGVLGCWPRRDLPADADWRWQEQAVWQTLGRAGYRTHVINWPRTGSGPAVNGIELSESYLAALLATGKLPPGPAGNCPAAAVAAGLADLPVRPADLDAAALQLFIPALAEMDWHNDDRPALLSQELARLFTQHSAALWALETAPWDFAAVHFDLLSRLAGPFLPFHPPRLPWVSELEFGWYQEVMNSAARFLDLLLGRLLAVAGPAARVLICSDHGLVLSEARPRPDRVFPGQPARQFAPGGLLLLAGPGCAPDALVHGAGVLDVAPTVLAAFQVPAPRSLPGRPLADVFAVGSPEREWIRRLPEAPRPEARSAEQSPEPFFDRPPAEKLSLGERIKADRAWNLVLVYYYSGRLTTALSLLERLHLRHPLRLDVGLLLVECRYRLGEQAAAIELIQALHLHYPEHPGVRLYHASAMCLQGDTAAGLAGLLALQAEAGAVPELLLRLGQVYELLNRTDDALRTYEKLAATAPRLAVAWVGIARCQLIRREFEAAAAAAGQALGIEYGNAEAHYCQGMAWGHLDRIEPAIRSLETSLALLPKWYELHRLLGWLYARRPQGMPVAQYHRLQYQDRRRQSPEPTAGAAAAAMTPLAVDRRQALAEFAAGDVPLVISGTGAETVTVRLADLAAAAKLHGRLKLPATAGSSQCFAAWREADGTWLGGGVVFCPPDEPRAHFELAGPEAAWPPAIFQELVRGAQRLARLAGASRLDYQGVIAELSPLQPLLQAEGFREWETYDHFEVPVPPMLAYTLALEAQLSKHGRIPPGARVVSLNEASPVAVETLVRRALRLPQFNLCGECAAGIIVPEHSLVALLNHRVVGVNLCGPVHDQTSVIPYTAVEETYRSGWVLPLLWRHHTEMALAHQVTLIRFRSTPEFMFWRPRTVQRLQAVKTGREFKMACDLPPPKVALTQAVVPPPGIELGSTV